MNFTREIEQEKIHRESKLENIPLENIEVIRTAKGSEYRYLEDGRTQRYKKVEDKLYDPQSILVFVPDYKWVLENAPAELLKQLGENEIQYTESLLDYIRNGEKDCYLLDDQGNKIETTADFKKVEGNVYLALGQKDKIDLTIPVSLFPRIGYNTYDTRKYKDEVSGQMKRERHLGNKVIDIIKKDSSL